MTAAISIPAPGSSGDPLAARRRGRASHGARGAGIRAAVLAGAALLSLAASAASLEPAPAVRAFVQGLGFSDADVAGAARGRIITRVLECRGAGDVAVAALLYVRAPREALLGELSQTRPFLTVGQPLQLGVFGDPPRLGDVASLRFDEGELREARGCQPRDCTLKLGQPAMGRVQGWDWRSPDAEGRLSELLKESMVETVVAYRRDGTLPVYLDKKRPISVAEELRASVDRSPHLAGAAPLLRYVLDYPRSALPGTRDVFYWSSERLRRPIVSVHHLAVQRVDGPGVVRAALADEHLSDNHYFRARLELLWLLDGGDPAGFYCVRLSRARIDPPGWFTGIALGKIRRATRSALGRQLAAARARLEASARQAEAGR